MEKWLASLPYNHKNYIRPEFFSDDNNDIDYNSAREAMYWAVKVGALKTNYEVYCPKCNERITVYHKQIDIPDHITCDDCQYEFNPWLYQEFIIVSFRLQKEGAIK